MWKKPKIENKKTKKLTKKQQELVLKKIEKEKQDKEELEKQTTEKKIEQMRNLMLRWVVSKGLLAKTLWVSRPTIYAWYDKIQDEFAKYTDSLQKKTEFGKLLDQLDMSFQKIWSEIMNSNMKEMQKVAAINTWLAPLRLKAELLWFMKGNDPFSWIDKTKDLVQVNQNIYNYYAWLMWWDENGIMKAMANWKIWKDKVKMIEDISWIKPI